MTERVQIQFIYFPGVEPLTQERGWRRLPMPWRTVDPNGDADTTSDAVMELIDYALARSPEAFGIDRDLAAAGYEPYNDLSIDLAGRVHSAVEGKGRVKGDGGLCEWYADVTLADGVVVRVASFR
jgi:hypothetical protein